MEQWMKTGVDSLYRKRDIPLAFPSRFKVIAASEPQVG